MPEFYDLWLHKFTNVTNGVTPRRWLADSNPALAEVLDEYVGEDWVSHMDRLSELENYADDPVVLEKIGATKLIGKHKLHNI